MENMMIGTTEALDFLKSDFQLDITLPTLIKNAKKFKFGVKRFGRWQIDKNKLKFYIESTTL